MTRKELVLEKLKELNQNQHEKNDGRITGCSAYSIAKLIGVDRSNVSRDLNALVEEGLAIKIKGKPVLFIERSVAEKVLDVKVEIVPVISDSLEALVRESKEPLSKEGELSLSSIIGSDGSLRFAIQQAKAAVHYPPNGLNILLTGATGVGKTTFAELIYNYGKDKRCLAENSKFVMFNCSEYADNPQLLLDHLFGHIKGAFTGADTHKKGLVEEAEGGILLLDEIHRLRPEGQEMLFMLIDKGYYRKLGESDAVNKASVMVVGATTEDPDSYLLRTFVRRFPMVIKIPELEKRPKEERFQLIRDFFLLEAQKMRATIQVDQEVILALLSYQCPANVGQLRTDIQLICARAFLDYIHYDDKIIQVDSSILPLHVKNTYEITDEGLLIENLWDNQVFTFDPEGVTPDISRHKVVNSYEAIYSKYRKMLREGKSIDEINYDMHRIIGEHFSPNYNPVGRTQPQISKTDIYKLVPPFIFDTVEKAIALAYGIDNLNMEVVFAIAMHIDAMRGRKANKFADDYPNDEFNVKDEKAIFVIDYIENTLSLKLNNKEAYFISAMLTNEIYSKENSEDAIVILVLSSLTKMGKILGDRIPVNESSNFYQYDISSSIDLSQMEEHISSKIKVIEKGKGVLVLTDIEFQGLQGGKLEKLSGKPVAIIQGFTGPMLIEAIRKGKRKDLDVHNLAMQLLNNQIERYQKGILSFELLTKESDRTFRIITSCITGEGVAIKVANHIKNMLPELQKYPVEFELANLEKGGEFLSDRNDILAVVGTVDLKIPNVPFITLDELILKDGIETIKRLIEKKSLTCIQDGDEQKIKQMLRAEISIIDEDRIYKEAVSVFCKLNLDIEKARQKSLLTRFIVHTACMLERTIQNMSLSHPHLNEVKQNHTEEFAAIRKAFSNIEKAFGVEIEDSEIAFIIDLISNQ